MLTVLPWFPSLLQEWLKNLKQYLWFNCWEELFLFGPFRTKLLWLLLSSFPSTSSQVIRHSALHRVEYLLPFTVMTQLCTPPFKKEIWVTPTRGSRSYNTFPGEDNHLQAALHQTHFSPIKQITLKPQLTCCFILWSTCNWMLRGKIHFSKKQSSYMLCEWKTSSSVKWSSKMSCCSEWKTLSHT